MKTLTKNINTFTLMTAVASALLTASAHAADNSASTIKLLSAHFDVRNVVQVEAGDFHFKPGQVAPIHTHSAPAVGYVAKGAIIYQVEGEKEQILREGDAFYEPVGPRILRFDNASATEEAIFIDFNLEQQGEPFIVFEKPPAEAIDRRTLPTIALAGKAVDQVDIYQSVLEAAGRLILKQPQPTLAIVAEGVVIVKRKGRADQRVIAGKSFSLPAGAKASVVNSSKEVPAKVISFRVL